MVTRSKTKWQWAIIDRCESMAALNLLAAMIDADPGDDSQLTGRELSRANWEYNYIHNLLKSKIANLTGALNQAAQEAFISEIVETDLWDLNAKSESFLPKSREEYRAEWIEDYVDRMLLEAAAKLSERES